MKRLFLLILILIPGLAFSQPPGLQKAMPEIPDTEPVSIGFVPNGNSVSMIDLSLGKIVYKLYTGQAPLGAAVGPDKKFVWVVNQGSGKTTIVDMTRRGGFAKAEVSSVFEAVWPVAFDQSGRVVYGISLVDSSLVGLSRTDSSMVRVDPVGFEVRDRKKLPEQSQVRDLAFAPDRKKLYVVWGSPFVEAGMKGYITILDPATGRETGRIAGGTRFISARMSPDGKFLLALDSASSKVSLVDTGTDKVVKDFPAGLNPLFLAVSPDWSRFAVTCGGDVFLYSLDLRKKSSKLISTVRFDGYAKSGAFDPTGKNLCVADRNGKQIVVLSAGDLSVVSKIQLNGAPAGVDLVDMMIRDRNALARWGSSERQDVKDVLNKIRNRGLKFKDAMMTGTIYETKISGDSSSVERKDATLYVAAPFMIRLEIAGGEVTVEREGKIRSMKDGVVTERTRTSLWYFPFGMVNVQESTLTSYLTSEAGDSGKVSIALDIMHIEEKSDGEFSVIGAIDGDNVSSQIWVNNSTNLPAKIIEKNPITGVVTETQFLDYHLAAASYWLPHQLDTYIDGQLMRSFILHEVTIDQGLSPSLFEL